jgi:O-methyltransferase involved in polyketide biosynthesis
MIESFSKVFYNGVAVSSRYRERIGSTRSATIYQLLLLQTTGWVWVLRVGKKEMMTMAAQKEKILLTKEQETLLITLYCKTLGCPGKIFEDRYSWQVIDSIEYDFSALRVPNGTRATVFLRAQKIDDTVRNFLAEHPGGVVLHLGCGLDTRFQRVDDGKVLWYDLDLPDVIAIRRKLFEETDRYHLLAYPVTEMDWMQCVPHNPQAVLVAAEGLLMYLTEEQVKALVLKLQQTFPRCELVCDVFSALTARNVGRNPSLKKTGAQIHWGVDDARTIEEWGQGIRLVEEWNFNQAEAIARMSFGFRLMFGLVGLLPVAQKAHRIVRFTL